MKKLTKAKLRQRAEDSISFVKDVRQDYINNDLELNYTDSGLAYVIHEEGDGAKPKQGQKVEVHYVGMLERRPVVFEESFGNQKGIRFVLGEGNVIPGWDEGIALLKEGDEATLFVPAKLAYGAKGRGQGIPPNSDLIFYVEVVAVG